jgi:hypothetical protein
MRIATIGLLLALAVTVGCKKKNNAGEALAKMTDFRDRMCACADKPCADKLNQEYMDWANKSSGGDKPTQMSEEDAKKITDVSLKYNECLSKWNAAGSGSDTGSGSAGSGSDSGSGSGMAGSGSGAEQTTMAHQAGNCPSTVLGSTTTAAVKGKDVVLTITATDKDAIASIQRRTEELLKEKSDDKSAGSAHDQKGTFGGKQGICPVYYGEGGSAKSKKDPKGVSITITPKDKPEDLKKEIDERITKAADFVKTIKPGDQGNQGGVGGGSGEHGSDHKGQGDGKGKERKGSGGTGGGAGTGGGGGAGTGGGGGSGAKAGSGSGK